MSADNWAECPKCRKRVEKEYADANKALREQYGKVSLEEYKKLEDVAKLKAHKCKEMDITLREDYEIGIYDGRFYIGYSGTCTDPNCDFVFHFDHKAEFDNE